MKRKFCIVTMPRSYSTAVCRKLIEVVSPDIEMPGPPKVGCELLHLEYIAEVSDFYGIPLNDDEREFIDAYLEREPPAPAGLRQAVSSAGRRLLKGPRTTFVGFKTFPFFHHYNEFFDREDITFIVLRRMNLDHAFLSWCVAIWRNNFHQTFDAKLENLRFAEIAEHREAIINRMRQFLFNLRGMSRLLERGAIDLVVDESERIVNNPRLDEFFGRTIDFSSITHRSNYAEMPDLDLFHERFQEALTFWRSRSTRPCALVEEFERRYYARQERAAITAAAGAAADRAVSPA